MFAVLPEHPKSIRNDGFGSPISSHCVSKSLDFVSEANTAQDLHRCRGPALAVAEAAMSHLFAQAKDRLAALENLRSALKIQYKKEKQALHQQYEQNNADLRRQITNLYNEIVFLQEAYHTEDCTSPEADQIEAAHDAVQIKAEQLEAAHDAVQIKAEQIKTEESEPIEAEANEAEQTEADEAERIEAVKIEANEAAHIEATDAEQIEADEADQIKAEQIEAAQIEAEQIEADEADEAEQIETDEATQNEAKQIETDEATQNAAKQIEADEAEHVAEHVAKQIDARQSQSDPDELDDVALTRPIGWKHKHSHSEPDEPVAVESHPKHDEPVAVVFDEPVAKTFILKRPLLRRIPLRASQSQSEPQEQVIRLNSGMLKRPMLQSKVEAPMPKAMPKVMPKAMPSQWQSIEQKARSPPKKRKLTSPSRPPLSPAPRRKRSPVPPREPPPAHLLPGFKLPSGYTCCPPSCRCQR